MRKFICCTFLVVVILVIGCSKTIQYNDPVPDHQTFTIQSTLLGETRTMNVWTPPEYQAGKDSLPVLYMPDGGLKEDFPHIANTLAELVKTKKIKPLILVGIENTQRRRDLTGPTDVKEDKEIAPIVGESSKFRAFIKDELFKEINKRYRTTNKNGIIGESLAGLFVTETFLVSPEIFDYYIAFDPSLWWNNQFLVKTAKENLSKFPSSHKRFWFAGSGAEDISSVVLQLARIIEAEKNPNITWKYSDEPKEQHSTIFRATKEKALIWTLNAR